MWKKWDPVFKDWSMYMVTRAIIVKPIPNWWKITKCQITSPIFGVQKCNAPFWNWHKNRVQMAQTIFESNKKWWFYDFFASKWTHFAKIALVTIYMLQSLKTGSHFFHKEPNYLLKIFLETISMIKVPKFAKMSQIFAIFQSL